MSERLEPGTIEIIVINKSFEGEELNRLHIVESEEELGEIRAWDKIFWTILTFEEFMPQTIENFLSGEDYEPHIFCDDVDDDDDVDVVIEKGDDED